MKFNGNKLKFWDRVPSENGKLVTLFNYLTVTVRARNQILTSNSPPSPTKKSPSSPLQAEEMSCEMNQI